MATPDNAACVRIPTAEEVLELHDAILATSGGEPGILVRGAVVSAVERATWGPFPGDDLAGRAALLLRGIAVDHPFADGNKRTAFETADAFLRLNGAFLAASQEAIVAFMLEVAQGEHDVEGIATWIRRNAQQI